MSTARNLELILLIDNLEPEEIYVPEKLIKEFEHLNNKLDQAIIKIKKRKNATKR